MTQQYLRNIRLLVGNKDTMYDFSKLKIVFEVKVLQMEVPDRCMVSIYNLPEDMIVQALENFTNVQLEVGYGNELQVLYQGEITYWRTYWQDNLVDRVLTLFSAQNQRAEQYGYMIKSWDAGATAKNIAEEVQSSWAKWGVYKDPGGLDVILPGTAYPRGHVTFGRTADMARTLGRDYNALIKIRNGKSYFVARDKPNMDHVIELNYNTGLLKQPEIVELGIKCECLLNPALSGGAVVHINTKDIIAPMPNKDTHMLTGLWGAIATSGLYYVLDVTHSGDTWGKQWTSSFLASVIQNLGKVEEYPA